MATVRRAVRRPGRGINLATWHRRLGLAAAFFVLVLAATGIALNHTAELGLDQRHLKADWLLAWYGIEAPTETISFAVGAGVVTQLGDRVYLDASPVEEGVEEVSGAVSIGELVVTAVDGDLLVLTANGERVERLGRKDRVPVGLVAVGIDQQGALLVRTDGGLFRADDALLGWSPVGDHDQSARWSMPAPTDAKMRATLRSDYLARILSLERVLLDLHSGRLFGRFGPWVMDIAATLLMLLAVTGIWLWSSRRS